MNRLVWTALVLPLSALNACTFAPPPCPERRLEFDLCREALERPLAERAFPGL